MTFFHFQCCLKGAILSWMFLLCMQTSHITHGSPGPNRVPIRMFEKQFAVCQSVSSYSPTLGIGHEQMLSRLHSPGAISPAVPMYGQVSSHLPAARCFFVFPSCLHGGPVSALYSRTVFTMELKILTLMFMGRSEEPQTLLSWLKAPLPFLS